MLACRTHPLSLSLSLRPIQYLLFLIMQSPVCVLGHVTWNTSPHHQDSNSLTEQHGRSIRDVKARARSTWHTDRHTSSLQHLVHDLVSTMQPREPASLLNESCGLPNRNGDVEEGRCLHAQVTPKFTTVSLSARGQVVQVML